MSILWMERMIRQEESDGDDHSQDNPSSVFIGARTSLRLTFDVSESVLEGTPVLRLRDQPSLALGSLQRDRISGRKSGQM